MRLRSLGVLSSVLLIGGLAGCRTDATTQAPRHDQVAVASYTPPPDAPTFCAQLARAGSLITLPTAIGRLITDPWNLEAAQEVAAGRADLQAVLADVRRTPGRSGETTLESLVAALTSVVDHRLTPEVAEQIRSGLDTLADELQPVCRFPT